MATQTVKFRAPPEQAGSLVVRLFAQNSDTIVQTASAISEATNRKGWYTATFTDVAAGDYDLMGFVGSTKVCEWVVPDLTLTTATFESYERETVLGLKFSGMTSLVDWLKRLARKDAGTAGMAVAETEIQSGGTATFVGTTDNLEMIKDTINVNVSNLGPGSDQVTIEILDDGDPVENVSVWISSDADGLTVIAGTLTTDALGQVTFLLTDGATYYLWAQKSGKISITGQSFVAEAD